MKQVFGSKLKVAGLAVYSLVAAFLIVCCIMPLMSSSEGVLTLGKSVSLTDSHDVACEQWVYTQENGEAGTAYIFSGFDTMRVRSVYLQLESPVSANVYYRVYSVDIARDNAVKEFADGVILANEYKDLLSFKPDGINGFRLDLPSMTGIRRLILCEGAVIPTVTLTYVTVGAALLLAVMLFFLFLLLLRLCEVILKNRKNSFARFKLLAGFLYLCLLVLWIFSQGFDRGPDELMRFKIPEFLLLNGRLPTAYDTEIIDPRWGFSYAGNPCLAYLIQAGFMKLFSVFGMAFGKLYLAARLANAVLGVIFLCLCTDISSRLTKNRVLVYTIVTAVCLLPQLIFVFTYVNPDAAMQVGIALILLSWIGGIRYCWRARDCMLLSAGMVVVVLSYAIGYSYILVSIPVFGISVLLNKQCNHRVKELLKKGTAISAMSLLGAGWFFIGNYRVHGTLYGGGRVQEEMRLQYGAEDFSAEYRAALARELMDTPRELLQWFWWSDVSFFGDFGYLDKAYSHAFYVGINVFAAMLALCAVARILKTGLLKDFCYRVLAFAMLTACGLTLLLSLYFSFTSDYEPQGRYLLPAALPLVLFLSTGAWQLTKWLKLKSAVLPTITGTFFFSLILYTLFRLIPV